ncbi:uncharacterized protein LTR77_004577 [Saxophila tyrrhenica]|uniref:Uncharacterized protein n=1 Tax=Saxophila tyrrhenica TaxID=1690608 RepID=A0AAV9PHB8_9PEZI|nr:hypothetical protein LTR77_004577 [Saxophila tyrrhenica]
MAGRRYNGGFEGSGQYSYDQNGAGPSSYTSHQQPTRRLPAIQSLFMPSARQQPERIEPPPPLTGDPNFDILDWYPAYQSCQRFFLDHAQHEHATQALCALMNIRLPFQHLTNPITSSRHAPAGSTNGNTNNYAFTFTGSNLSPDARRNGHSPSATASQPPVFISLIPYIRRLVVTGFDRAPILHGFFGDDYTRGILPHLDCERRNYLFATKAGGFRSCKKQYDNGSGLSDGTDESVPYMSPMEDAKVDELMAAEKGWSKWLAMEDWMVGERRPSGEERAERREEAMGGRYTGSGIGGSENLPDGVGDAFRGGS